MGQAWKPVLEVMPLNSIQMIDSSVGVSLVFFAEENLIREFLHEEEPCMTFQFHALDIYKEFKLAVNYNDSEDQIVKKSNVFETVVPNNSKSKRMIRKLKTQQVIH